VLVKRPKEAKAIVAQQSEASWHDTVGYRDSRSTLEWFGIEVVRVYDSIVRKKIRVGLGFMKYDIFSADETIEEQHGAVPNTRPNTDDRAPGITGPTVWAREDIVTSAID
jgi:hypothetical protein